jgi:hypothetical protein
VTVTDNTPPVVRLNGDNPLTEDVNEAPTEVTTECGAAFNDLGATAVDSCLGPVPVTTSTINTGVPGTYTIVYSATDGTNVGTASRIVHVVDTTAPVIAMNGANPLQVECHTNFVDPGATANDGCAGSFPATASGSVNANVPGTYTITYTATDPSGNVATSVTRTVNVVDTLAPVITLNGASPMTVECHTSFTDPGATAFDACLNASVAVTASGSVNANVPGTYTITYSATDGVRSSTKTRTVNVVDTIAPTLTLKNVSISLWPPNHKYKTINLTDLVLSASDSCDGGIDINDVVISKVTSDETENGNGDGNTTNDIIIAANCKSVQLRVERDGGGDGRVYTITFRVRDASGNTTTKTAKVTVPENQSGGAVVDSGAHYTVNGNCP